MAEWKRPLFIGIGWGLGTAVGLPILVGGFLWYQSRPKPPRPWNTTAIKADYDYAITEGDNNTVVFHYTLQNTTDFDYQIAGGQGILMTAKLEQQKNLQPFDESEKLDYPISVPAKKRVRFLIHLSYTCPVRLGVNATSDERRDYRKGVEKYIATEMSNLDGFDLLDETNRYEIIFPPGWKQTKK